MVPYKISYRVAKYIDHFINPLAKLHSSYIKDTYDFVNKLKSLIIPADSFLFTIDVDALDTNTDTDLGIVAVSEAFNRSPRSNRIAKFCNFFTSHLLEMILSSIKKIYLQISGCAMGRKYNT